MKKKIVDTIKVFNETLRNNKCTAKLRRRNIGRQQLSDPDKFGRQILRSNMYFYMVIDVRKVFNIKQIMRTVPKHDTALEIASTYKQSQ